MKPIISFVLAAAAVTLAAPASAHFKEYADKMQAEMSKLSAAAKTGNFESIKAAATATGSSCKTCHDAFRKD